MISSSFQACLSDVHKGEILGESAFDQMLLGAVDSEQIYILGSLFQFETESKAILRPLLVRLGPPNIRGPGEQAGGVCRGK
jgi:hypothetical protein